MTVVEFLDCTPVKNIISGWTLSPDRIIYVGSADMRNQVERCRTFFERKKRCPEIITRMIRENKIDTVYEVLAEIAEEEEECIFDLTGGDEVALVAMGMVYERYRFQKKIEMHRFEITSGRISDVDNDGELPKKENEPQITVEDTIILHGGTISAYFEESAGGSGKRGAIENTPEFSDDVQKLWAICRENPAAWNRAISDLKELESRPFCEKRGFEVKISLIMSERDRWAEAKRRSVERLLSMLAGAGLVHNYHAGKEYIQYCYKNASVRHCLDKAGNILELKVLTSARAAREKDGSPYYSDALSGVSIDWDGKEDLPGGTVNEIDVVLMRGFVPIFISCKNGEVDDDELYKLNTVALRFGGDYARKVLVASEIRKSGSGMEYFMQRASDMGIVVIDGAAHLSEEEFERKLRSAAGGRKKNHASF